MKKAKLSNASTLFLTYLCHDYGIGSQTCQLTFEKHEKMLDKERGFHDGTIFKVPRSFDFFIKGAREVNKNFTKITHLALYSPEEI
jgi:hypothetical protein